MEPIYDILIKEHGQVLNLFKEAISDGSKETFLKIKAELDPHLQGEEKLLYPVLKEKEKARESVLEGYEEHRIAEMLLSELENCIKRKCIFSNKPAFLKSQALNDLTAAYLFVELFICFIG
jgi:iron-sulfur cluster repair protein YtfE (RIC family)